MSAWYILPKYPAIEKEIIGGSQKCNIVCNLYLLDVQLPKVVFFHSSTKAEDRKTNKQVNHYSNHVD
jgi:hypothetical protein